MKIAIFSDVHGNNYAFNKVMESMLEKEADTYIFCGDICGYYYGQNEIIDQLRQMDRLHCILGNHDQIFLDILSGVNSEIMYREKYGRSMELLRKQISDENLNFLKSLKTEKHFSIRGFDIGIFHGDPWNHLSGYVYPDTSIEEFSDLPYDYILLGHTHYRLCRTINNKTIINPGSCGQPRDGRLPSYVILDLDSNSIEFYEVKFDPTLLVEDIVRHNERNNYLIDILYRRSI